MILHLDHANRIWVMDRGMVSKANLTFLRSREGRYIVGTPKATWHKFEKQLVEKNWEEVQAGVEDTRWLDAQEQPRRRAAKPA